MQYMINLDIMLSVVFIKLARRGKIYMIILIGKRTKSNNNAYRWRLKIRIEKEKFNHRIGIR